jgi:hypothetical protein
MKLGILPRPTGVFALSLTLIPPSKLTNSKVTLLIVSLFFNPYHHLTKRPTYFQPLKHSFHPPSLSLTTIITYASGF